MPIFEYVCRSCEHAFEQIVEGAARPKCPECGSRSAAKQLSVFATSVKDGGADGDADFGAQGACGSCGDPRGPGACELD
jgi:putative FmdB family regulatory protein